MAASTKRSLTLKAVVHILGFSVRYNCGFLHCRCTMLVSVSRKETRGSWVCLQLLIILLSELTINVSGHTQS